MGRPLVNPRPPEGDFLSADEIIGAFEALSRDDKRKLSDIEAVRRRGTGYGKNGLIHEALVRALNGDRNCPRNVVFMAFMVQTMRSIADHDRTQRLRLRSLEEDAIGSDAKGGRNTQTPSPVRSAEDLLIEKEATAAVQSIHRCFDDDPEAQLVLMGWEDELRGAALREATGLDQGQLDYAIKRIRSRMKKQFPEGWIT